MSRSAGLSVYGLFAGKKLCIGLDFLRTALIYKPSALAGRSPADAFVSLLPEYHSQSVEGQRSFYGAEIDEFLAYLRGGEELAPAGGDVEEYGEELFLVVLRPELVLVLRHLGYLVLLEPVGVAHLDEVFCLGVHASVGETRVGERALYACHLEGQPAAVAGDVGEELALVAARAERGEAQTAFLGVAVGDTLVDVHGGDEGLEAVDLAAVHGIYLVEVDESELRQAQTVVLGPLGVGHLAGVAPQFGRDEVLEPRGLVDALLADEHQHPLVDGIVAQPRGDHGDEPFAEAAVPQFVLGFVHEGYLVSHLAYPVGFFLRIVRVLLLHPLAQGVHLRQHRRVQDRQHLAGGDCRARLRTATAHHVVDVAVKEVPPETDTPTPSKEGACEYSETPPPWRGLGVFICTRCLTVSTRRRLNCR